jgi:hypothetical protein
MGYVRIILNGQLAEVATHAVVGKQDFKKTLSINGKIILKLVIQQAQNSMQGRDVVNTVRNHMIPHNTGELSDQLKDFELLKSTVP